jgi:hypothetical protein
MHEQMDVIGSLRAEVAAVRAELVRLRTDVQQLLAPATVLPIGTLRRAEAAKMLGVRIGTMARWATLRRGPSFFLFHGRAYYRRADLEAWARNQVIARAEDARMGGGAEPELPLLSPLSPG